MAFFGGGGTIGLPLWREVSRTGARNLQGAFEQAAPRQADETFVEKYGFIVCQGAEPGHRPIRRCIVTARGEPEQRSDRLDVAHGLAP